ncbi:PhnD/SsuA/transferrin family substrate-binding protein [Azoarcus sp. KH32C]|uniref:substrate-binding domain-containing protein n=1 Tax=Azoarcus sp. KH32C TaxID=748247 RepID=UPI0035102940
MLHSRRRFLACAAGLAAMSALPARATDNPVRIGLTPVFLDDQMSFLTDWRRWLEVKLGHAVVFIQRGNYREVVDLVRTGKLDFAWLCGFPFVQHQRELKLLAVPLWRGGPYYRSYIIVPADDTRSASITDLRGKVFAYSDPDSNSGYLYPRYLLTTRKEDPANFFSRTFFTWAHRKVVEAVGVALADGGAVDGYVWETLAEVRPELTRRTRIIERSPQLGHPPFVARADIPRELFDRFQATLLGMANDPVGEELLRRLHLDGFTRGEPALFAEIARMAARVERQ